MMKKVYLFLLIIYTVGLSACKTDEAVIPSNLQNPALIGKWYLQDLTTRIQTTGNGNNSDITIPYSGFGNYDFFEFKIRNEATYSSAFTGKAYEGYYSTNTNIIAPRPIFFKSGNFELDFSIQSLTSTTMVLFRSSSVEQGGVTTTTTNTYTYTH
ncbi:hypothetical protein KHS38_06040 [Mucilaginibacter sp. Bleaf8]|uniref:hypothetical protein n=1 Tax=Mucilaginibacter sp. Bleaf8 TaxID=2834430 RepID=UPI001BCE5FBC|nr:hypothetical protein [Mucilaginibacter sp. Bleaf8]MBS7563959.1 hypothetical protein [Mucilaginibacter sp. Bleaf8]